MVLPACTRRWLALFAGTNKWANGLNGQAMYRIWDFITSYSILLISGAVAALFWANLDLGSYHQFIHTPLLLNHWVGELEPGSDMRVLSVGFLINDILMALFFAIAAKEVWEAVALKSGSLRGKKALTPLIATAGGMTGPVLVFLGLAFFVWPSTFNDVAHGWAIPTATDIAFSYLVGRLVFGAGHPAVRFLLLLAIADDAGGLIILAIFYPSGDLAPLWLLVSLASALSVFFLFNWLPIRLDRGDALRPASTWVRRHLSIWPYVIAGVISWYSFQRAGIHPALGLLPIVPTIPQADRAFGIFAEAEQHLGDLLNRLEHMLQVPVEIVLFFFGLANAGVALSSVSEPTALVVLGLLIGKPLGIFSFGWVAARVFRLGLPAGMRTADLVVVGCVAAIGFTVALFVATVAFKAGPVQDAAKMGALLSFAAAGVSVIAGKLFGVTKKHEKS